MFDDDPAVIDAIAKIAASHATPEDIDDGPMTAPSKRLCDVFAAYQKALHGPLAVAAIGLDRIRATCPHFVTNSRPPLPTARYRRPPAVTNSRPPLPTAVRRYQQPPAVTDSDS
jgi:hypothetical protein